MAMTKEERRRYYVTMAKERNNRLFAQGWKRPAVIIPPFIVERWNYVAAGMNKTKTFVLCLAIQTLYEKFVELEFMRKKEEPNFQGLESIMERIQGLTDSKERDIA